MELDTGSTISIPHNSTVVFQPSLSGRLEHSYSFQLSHQPLDVMDENQQPWSGQVAKKRLFKGIIPYGLFSNPLQKVHSPAFPSEFFSVQAHHQHTDSCSNVCSVVDPKLLQHLEANSSQQLEINEAGRVEDSGMRHTKFTGMLSGGCTQVLHPGEMDFCCSKSGVTHTFWTRGDQNAKGFEKNVEAITCGD